MKIAQTLVSMIRRAITTLTSMSYVELGALYITIIMGCGYAYFLLATYAPEHGPGIGGGPVLVRLFNSIYFSAITATSVGYGDVRPHGISKLIASLQGMMTLFTFAIFVSKPVSERQDAALYQMHKLTLDEIFTSVREGFYIMRRDFDSAIHAMESGAGMSSHTESNLQTALYQGQVLMEDIPTFYDTEKQLYILDQRRETLLAEAVERTCGRLARVYVVAREKNVTLSKETTSAAQEFRQQATSIMQIWKRHATSAVHRHIDQAIASLKSI